MNWERGCPRPFEYQLNSNQLHTQIMKTKDIFNYLTKWLGLQSKTAGKISSKRSSRSCVCCSNLVHVAYRGVSDDRLYLAHNRQWTDVKFFRQHGLRAFCAVCRKRVL